MYLILVKNNSCLQPDTCVYNSIFTDSIVDVAQAFRDAKTIKVFKLDSLTEIKEVQIEVTETPKELT